MDTKEKILINSRELFISSGFSNITMDDIAAELAMSKKTLYKHFPNKESLLKEAIMSQFIKIEDRVNSLVRNNKLEIIEKFRKISEIIIYYISKLSPAFLRDIKKNAPEIWEIVNKERRRLISKNFSKVVDQGINCGKLRKDLDKELVIMIYLTTIENMINPGALSEAAYNAGQVFDTIFKLFFEGILSDKGRRKLKKTDQGV